MPDQARIAFALGGLGGNNAFGAGFLQAALDKNIEPLIISCTSGQIFWVYQYLTVKNKDKDLRRVLEAGIDEIETTHNPDLDLAILALFGKRDVFHPAYAQVPVDFYINVLDSSKRMTQDWLELEHPFLLKEILSTIPARILIPKFPENFFKAISQTFNEATIGLAFNSYDPRRGIEYIHLNEVARHLLVIEEKRRKHSYRVRTEYKEITPAAVQAGLWLYQYGFDQQHEILDGAYFRQIMLSELVVADKIYVMRPINLAWLGDLPKNYVGVEDLKLETAFNGVYVGERDKIDLINKFLTDKAINPKKIEQKGYHHIEVIEVEIETQEGLFDYIFEKMSVFDLARTQTKRKFDQTLEKMAA